MRRRLTPLAVLLAGGALLAAGCEAQSAGSAEDFPSDSTELVIAFGPGGGNDIMSRTLAGILEDEGIYPERVLPENREGGAGATGWGYVFSQTGNPYVASTTSGSFITTPLQADTGWTYSDFTPVGLLAADHALILVDPASGIQTWDDWVEHARESGPVAVGGNGTVQVDFILHAMAAEQSGYEIDYVPFNEVGQLETAMLSGSVEAIVLNPAEAMGQIEAGAMQPILYSGEEAPDALGGVTTVADAGLEGIPSMPRGFILPPDVPEDVQDWWIDALQQVVETDAWQEYLETNLLVPDTRWGDDFTAYLDEVAEQFEQTLTEHGAL